MTSIRSQARPKLRRSSKACCRCHERKVRCDVARLGPPCSNCRLRKINCVLIQPRKRSSVPSSPPLIPPRGRRKRLDSATDISLSPDETSPPEYLGEPLQQEGPGPEVSTPVELSTPVSVPTGLLPPYINPIPQGWPQADVEYLSKKQAFAIPEPALRNVLLRSYVEWVHPLCPVIDLHDFLTAISRPDGSGGRISLLVFYAVLLAGAAFVDESYLAAAGYKSGMTARKDFFVRVKLLYSMSYERDRVRIVQALLLMSYWQETHDDPENHWYWAEVGCVIARATGLYMDPSSASMSEGAKRLWRRVGWSCMLRDRVLNLGVRMPPKIKADEFHLPPLQESDFEIAAYSAAITDMLAGCELLRNPGLQARVARMCIAKTRLCILLGQVFDALYTPSTPKLGTTTEVTLVLTPKAEELRSDDTSRLERELRSWLHNLPGDLQHQQTTEPTPGSSQEVPIVHYSLVMMYYHAILCAFYRPQLVSSPTRDLIRQRLGYATLMITRHLEHIQTYGLLRFLPSSSVTFLLTAAVNHLVEYKALEDEESKHRHLRRFRDCLCYLKPLQSIHIYARYAGMFLESAAHRAGIMPSTESTYTSLKAQWASSSDRDELGPWAVSHTPDQLVARTGPSFSTSRYDAERFSPALATAEAEARIHPDRVGTGHLGHGGNVDLQQSFVWPLEYAEVENMLASTVWEHGWVDEIAEKWPEYLVNHQGFDRDGFNVGGAHDGDIL